MGSLDLLIGGVFFLVRRSLSVSARLIKKKALIQSELGCAQQIPSWLIRFKRMIRKLDAAS